MTAHTKTYDCIVVGGGPGGLVAALYLLRFQRRVLIVDAGDSRVRWIPKVRNLPGQDHGIRGQDLLRSLHNQLKKYRPQFVKGSALVKKKGKRFEVIVKNRKFASPYVILATGMKDIEPNIKNLHQLRKTGLLAYCPICDGFEYRKKKVGLLVQDKEGLSKMRVLRSTSKELCVFQMQKFKVSKSHLKEMREHQVPLFCDPVAISLADPKKRQLQVKLKEGRIISLDVLYIGLGTVTDQETTKYLPRLRRNRKGFLQTNCHQQTSVPGLFAVGDCVSALSQISVAAGHAATAATQVHNLLLKNEIPL